MVVTSLNTYRLADWPTATWSAQLTEDDARHWRTFAVGLSAQDVREHNKRVQATRVPGDGFHVRWVREN